MRLLSIDPTHSALKIGGIWPQNFLKFTLDIFELGARPKKVHEIYLTFLAQGNPQKSSWPCLHISHIKFQKQHIYFYRAFVKLMEYEHI